MAQVRISSKHQIVIPREAREKLGLRPGDRLLSRVEDGRIIFERRPRSFTEALSGVFRSAYGDVREHLRRERSSWGG